jgi:hypothetical protein
MAKKRAGGDVNVSATIRDFLAANPAAGPTEAAEAVSQQIGKPVSPTYVSNIKSLAKATPKKRRRRGRPAGARARQTSASATNGNIDLATIEAMKTILGRVGPATAKRLIDVLA